MTVGILNILIGIIADLHVPGGEPSAQKRKAEELEAAEYQQAGAAEGPGQHKQVSSAMSRHSAVEHTCVQHSEPGTPSLCIN